MSFFVILGFLVVWPLIARQVYGQVGKYFTCAFFLVSGGRSLRILRISFFSGLSTGGISGDIETEESLFLRFFALLSHSFLLFRSTNVTMIPALFFCDNL